jgi:hypothetical protein
MLLAVNIGRSRGTHSRFRSRRWILRLRFRSEILSNPVDRP